MTAMVKKYAHNVTRPFSGLGLTMFSQDDFTNIHNASLEIFEEIGIKVESEEALEIFAGAGASVTRETGYGIVKIPAWLVEDCIASTPGTVVYKGRTPDKDFTVSPGRVSFSTFGECLNVIDPVTRKHRASTKQDNANIARLCDSFDEIGMVLRPVGACDMPGPTQSVHNAHALFSNTSKHLHVGAVNRQNLAVIHKMCDAIAGGADKFAERGFYTCALCPTSPLTLVQDCCDMIIDCARKPGSGIQPISMALAGASGPATLAGTLVNHNVEVLSAIILGQLVRKGMRSVYAGISTIMDMKQMVATMGAPELGMLGAGVANMARHYNIPCLVGSGVCDSKIPDAQSAYEATFSMMTGALSGANFVYGLGTLDQGMTFDFAKFITDVEMAKMIFHAMNGIPVSDETLALDLTRQVGPGGEFLTQKHTFQHMRELSQPFVFDRRNRAKWEADGAKDITEVAYEKAAAIINSHEPTPLSDDIAKELQDIVDAYEREIL